MPGRSYVPVDDYRYGFNAKEEDDDLKGEGNSYDFGARMYDARLGRWMSTDPLEKNYPSMSAYSFVANSPLNAIDPDGRVIIFINGIWGWPMGVRECGENYWLWDGQWVQRLKNHWNDQNAMFFDGSVGGTDNAWNNTIAPYRTVAGYNAGYAFAEDIISNLSPGETIKFVTNSMGAAFQRGFSNGLMTYIYEEQIKIMTKRSNLLTRIIDTRAKIEEHNEKFYGGSNPLGRYDIILNNWNKIIDQCNSELVSLQEEYDKLEAVTIEIVVDIDPHQSTERDQNAQQHYYILSDRSKYDPWEKGFLDIQPVDGAVDASKKNNKNVLDGHHSSHMRPEDLPQP